MLAEPKYGVGCGQSSTYYDCLASYIKTWWCEPATCYTHGYSRTVIQMVQWAQMSGITAGNSLASLKAGLIPRTAHVHIWGSCWLWLGASVPLYMG